MTRLKGVCMIETTSIGVCTFAFFFPITLHHMWCMYFVLDMYMSEVFVKGWNMTVVVITAN